MTDKDNEKIQHWTAKRRTALVLSILRGETSAKEAARKHGLTTREVETWKDRFLSGSENALRSKPRDDLALKDVEIKKLRQKVGELVMDIDILKAAGELRPFLGGGVRRVMEMVLGASERRVCRVLEVSRSSVCPKSFGCVQDRL